MSNNAFKGQFTEKIYQRIGEFVVYFQWLENLIRQIGWLISDPGRKEWPPQSLRQESNNELLNKVEKKYHEMLDKRNTSDSKSHKEHFSSLINECHSLRNYRNNLLHSAYIEFKAGGKVMNLIRSNPKPKRDEDGEYGLDVEIITEEKIKEVIKEMGVITMALGFVHTQLIHSAS